MSIGRVLGASPSSGVIVKEVKNMAKYRKTFLVEAIRYNGLENGKLPEDIKTFFKQSISDCFINEGELFIHTLEGVMHVTTGAYIVLGVHKEAYACAEDIFNKTYELVEE